MNLIAHGSVSPDSLLLRLHCLAHVAGDPVEIGAIMEVYLSAAAQLPASSAPLSLASSKSWFGHAEPAAGMVGVAHTLLLQQQRVQLPIMHLRTLNPMVAGMLEASAAGSAGRGVLMPRQAGPGVLDGGVVLTRTGVSAFAFQVRV